MPEFQCKVVTAEGVILDRTLSGESVDAVYSILKERKEQLISVKKKGLSLNLGKLSNKQKKIKPFFCFFLARRSLLLHLQD